MSVNEQLYRKLHELNRFMHRPAREGRPPMHRDHETPAAEMKGQRPEMRGYGPEHMHFHGPEMKEHGPENREPAPMRGPAHPPVLARERILCVMAPYENGIHQKELVQELHIGAPSVSEFVNKLEASGYIERKTDPDDKRATLLYLTDLGKARAAELEDQEDEHLNMFFGNLTDEEKQEMIRLVDKMMTVREEENL